MNSTIDITVKIIHIPITFKIDDEANRATGSAKYGFGPPSQCIYHTNVLEYTRVVSF